MHLQRVENALQRKNASTLFSLSLLFPNRVTNAQEGLQNLDDSTRSVAPQVCRSQEPKVKLGLQHAATGLFRSRPV